MGILLGIVFFFVSFFILAVILLQEGKGGGLAAMGGAATDSVMGARNPLRRWTVYFFISFIVLVVGINYFIGRQQTPGISTGLSAPSISGGAMEAPAVPENKDATAKEEAPAAAPAGTGEKPAEVKPAGEGEAVPAQPAPETMKKPGEGEPKAEPIPATGDKAPEQKPQEKKPEAQNN